MPTRSEESRLLSITTPLPDELLLTAMHGHEALSQLFSFQLELAAENEAVAADKIIGKPVTVSLLNVDADPREFHGYISHFIAGELREDGRRAYHAEMVPWLWFLSLTGSCRIYQNQTTKDIIEHVFKDINGFTDFRFSLSGSYSVREYCVQYNESDLEFVSRLLEEEGIFYFFEHANGKHTMVLADSKSAYKACDDSEVEYQAGHLMGDQLTSWSSQYSYVTGSCSCADYNFESPSTKIKSTNKSILKVPGITNNERYSYPGGISQQRDADSRTKVWMEGKEATYHVVNSGGTYRSFMPGKTFTIGNHLCESEKNKKYVITEISHQAADDSYSAGGGAGNYQNYFSCIPADVVFRPAMRHKKPAIYGPQTAVVVGPSGEEIYTDKYGRVKVQFYWDREGKNDENSSCWVRVAQAMVGKKWGAIFVPRKGQEVVVSFIDGDLDRPLITGCVYNADFMPPYDLPANKTQSGFKTRSSKGGDAKMFNELRFEDKKGEEEIYIHAQKDFVREVENDESLTIKKNRSTVINEGNDTFVLEKGNVEKTLKSGNETIKLEKGNHSTSLASGNMDIKLDSGDLSANASAGKVSIEASNSIEFKVGASSIKMTATGIVLKNGSNTVKIEPAGITIKGTMVKAQGDAMAEVKSPMTTVKGDGMLTLKGGVTMIN